MKFLILLFLVPSVCFGWASVNDDLFLSDGTITYNATKLNIGQGSIRIDDKNKMVLTGTDNYEVDGNLHVKGDLVVDGEIVSDNLRDKYLPIDRRISHLELGYWVMSSNQRGRNKGNDAEPSKDWYHSLADETQAFINFIVFMMFLCGTIAFCVHSGTISKYFFVGLPTHVAESISAWKQVWKVFR